MNNDYFSVVSLMKRTTSHIERQCKGTANKKEHGGRGIPHVLEVIINE